jgi:NAD(P)H-hydrate epimerase
MVGAPLLAARAALRTGAGLVTVASYPAVVDKLEKRVEEVMTRRLPTDLAAAVEDVQKFIKARKVNVLVLGPGQDKSLAEFSRKLLARVELPVVLDAAAMTEYAGNLHALNEAAGRMPLILTPHAGEFKKLTGQAPPANGAAKEKFLADFTRRHRLTLIYKGNHSLVASSGGEIHKNESGNPGLATAGTGDVLDGVVAGLLAQGVAAQEAAELGTYLHGLAGDIAARQKTEPAMIASDVIEALPEAYKRAV